MTDEDTENPEIIAGFERVARRMGQMDELRNVVGTFLTEFALFESMSLTYALKALSSDPILVEHLPELMDLYGRLKLMKQLGVAGHLPKELQDDIAHVRKVGNALLKYRNDIAHGLPVLIGPFLTDPDAELTPGVQRRRSERIAPTTEQTQEQLNALNLEWSHSVPTIIEWIQITVQLERATRQLAERLQRHRNGEDWRSVVVVRVTMPDTKAGKGS